MTSVEIPTSVAAALPNLSVFDITNDVSRAVKASGCEAGLAYVAAASPSAVVRVTERESGFFHDFEAMLVDGEYDLDDLLLDGHTIVGLTAGASTPEELVQGLLSELAEGGYTEVEEVTVAREDVSFRLPREVIAS